MRVFLLSLLVALPALAADGAWETVQSTPFVIKIRAVPGSEVKEVWAEADMKASPEDVQAAVMAPDDYAKFMPYVKESRTFGKETPEGERFAYTRLDFGSLVTSRDYVVRVKLVKDAAQGGVFENKWVAEPDKLPSRANSIRVRVNEGSWHAEPNGKEGESHVTYRFLVDPGGWVPTFAANIGNRKGVSDTIRAVEQEAQKRAKARQQAAK